MRARRADGAEEVEGPAGVGKFGPGCGRGGTEMAGADTGTGVARAGGGIVPAVVAPMAAVVGVRVAGAAAMVVTVVLVIDGEVVPAVRTHRSPLVNVREPVEIGAVAQSGGVEAAVAGRVGRLSPKPMNMVVAMMRWE